MMAGARILITGGSGGIGGAIAVACAARGGWPIVGYRGNESGARAVVELCGRGEVFQIDLQADAVHCAPVEAVVHCAAAFAPERSLLEAPREIIAEQLAVNFLGPLALTRAALAASDSLRRVVFVLSTASFCRGTGPYALSKAAELALCRLLSNELTPSGVRVDAVVPGWTATPMAERAARAKGLSLDEIAREHPDGELLHPREIGELCATLLFDHQDVPPGDLILWDRRDHAEPISIALSHVTTDRISRPRESFEHDGWLGQSLSDAPARAPTGASLTLCPSHRKLGDSA